jgi:hypothetical protein
MEEHNIIIGPEGTAISMDGRYLTARYRDTDIVKVSYLEVVLDAGGSRSFIIQSRLNQVSRQFNLSYNIRSREREWVVETPAGTFLSGTGCASTAPEAASTSTHGIPQKRSQRHESEHNTRKHQVLR